MLAQLDRQALSEQILVKTACVLGSSRVGETQAAFERSRLQALFSGSVGALDGALLSLERWHTIEVVENCPNDVRYRFHATAVGDVIYGLMLKAQRERIHMQVGESYERECARRRSAGLALAGTAAVRAARASLWLLRGAARQGGEVPRRGRATRTARAARYEAAERRFTEALALHEKNFAAMARQVLELLMPPVGDTADGAADGAAESAANRQATRLFCAHILHSLAESYGALRRRE